MLKRGLVATSAFALLLGACDQSDESMNDSQSAPAKAGDGEVESLRLLATGRHENGNSFLFLQARDASLVVAERGVMGKPALPVGEDLEMVALYRQISPGAEVPRSLVEADRAFRQAKEQDLFGTAWLPAAPDQQPDLAAIRQAVSVGADRGGNTDPDFFRDTFCVNPGDNNFRCFINGFGNWTYNHDGTVWAGRDITTGMVSRAGHVKLEVTTCWWRFGCKFSYTSAVAQDEWLRWRLRGRFRGASQQTNAGTHHFASTIPSS